MLKEKEIKKVIKPNVNIERIIKDDDFGYSLSVSEIKFK